MKFAEFLKKNVKWNLSKDMFSDLCCAPTEKSALLLQMQRLAEKYYTQQRHVETSYTEFCLNEIAIASAKTSAQRFVKAQFGGVWQSFLRLKRSFTNATALFPADENQTRVEAIAKLIAQCTQFAVSRETLEELREKACEIFDLSDGEKRALQNVVRLARINFFCATSRGIFKKSKFCEIRLAKMCDKCNVDGEFIFNAHLSQAGYATEKLAANINCLGASATKLSQPTQTETRCFLFSNGRNVFDTFCYSKFGNNTAQFWSQSGALRVEMQYFLQGASEIRRYTIANNGKSDKKIAADFLLRHLNASNKTRYFPYEGALCLSVEGENEHYAAAALVQNHQLLPCTFEEGRISHIFEIPSGQKVNFALVTVFASNMPELAEALSEFNRFGATNCPYLADTPSANTSGTSFPLHPTAHGFLPRTSPQKGATTLNFTFRLGDEKGATFLDNAGNCTTLLEGFPFTICGEKVFAVKNNSAKRLNCGKFAIENNGVVFKKRGDAVCKIVHEGSKCYKIESTQKQRFLFFFPLEEKCEITLKDNAFCLKGALREFDVHCVGKVESFSANELECNADRMRYKLSNELQCGTCLAICFAAAHSCEVDICAKSVLPQATPLVRESLVSTYLNCVNEKNVFCLFNCLKRIDALTLAATAFTNPNFIKFFAENLFESHRFFYDAAGQKKQFFDRLALPLALVYYANITNDAEFPNNRWKNYIEKILFEEKFVGRELCIQALALKKAASVCDMDKAKCIAAYNNLKRSISCDAKLYAYAQAIGAVPMLNPSKERLKDLCGRFDIPKSWYYVSQLENLYGLTLCEGTLQFAPKVARENVLEQLALNFGGKRIDTTFVKSAVQSMTLNGITCFLPLKTNSLNATNNVLEVRYKTQ